ncbi:hypothetical protein BDV10DRAFT_160357 [Aspergillus recurvatus]
MMLRRGKGDCTLFRITLAVFEKVDRNIPLNVTALGMNGKECTVLIAWTPASDISYISSRQSVQSDGSHANCGPARDERGQPHHCGGHASECHDLLQGEAIDKFMICTDDDGWGSLTVILMVLGNGEA